jgi:hypothetical protein
MMRGVSRENAYSRRYATIGPRGFSSRERVNWQLSVRLSHGLPATAFTLNCS